METQKIYTDKEVTRAEGTAQMIGFAQGAGAVIVAGIGLKLLGWIPVLLVLGGGAWVLYKMLVGRKGPAEGTRNITSTVGRTPADQRWAHIWNDPGRSHCWWTAMRCRFSWTTTTALQRHVVGPPR